MVVHDTLSRGNSTPLFNPATGATSQLAHLGTDLDVILADFALPGFDALRALELLQARGLDIPSIIVSGTIGEEMAVEVMKRGATNYLLKDRLARLGAAVAQALEAKSLRDEMRRAQEALRESAALNRAVLDSLTAHIAVLGSGGRIITTNEAWQQGCSESCHPLLDARVGTEYTRLLERFSQEDEETSEVFEGFLEVLKGRQTHFRAEFPCRPEDERCFLMTVTPLGSHGGGTVVACEDITDRKRYEAEIQFLAYHDPLTRLANRRRFREQFELELCQAERYGEALTVFFFDLDRFKSVNDAHGHDAGDDVLKQAVERITAEVRSSDVLARLGGDEFAALLHNTDADSSVALAKRIVESFRDPFNAAGHPVHIGVSIGIASYPKDAATIEVLLSHADIAAYRAKSGGLGFCLHEEAEHRSTRVVSIWRPNSGERSPTTRSRCTISPCSTSKGRAASGSKH